MGIESQSESFSFMEFFKCVFAKDLPIVLNDCEATSKYNGLFMTTFLLVRSILFNENL